MRVLARLPYDVIFGTVYFGLRLNLCLVVACAPLLSALAVTRDPLSAWPFFVALGAVCGPAASAAFTTFAAFSAGSDHVVREFWTAYRNRFWRSLGLAGAAALLLIVLGFDILLTAGTPFAAAAPMLALLILLTVAVTTSVLVGEDEPLSWRWLMACGYLTIRKWYLSLANLAVLGVLAAAVVAKPAIGLFLLPAPALYVVWANARHATAR